MTANFNTYFSDDLLKHATFPRVPATPDEVAATVQYIIENKFLNGVDIPVSYAKTSSPVMLAPKRKHF